MLWTFPDSLGRDDSVLHHPQMDTALATSEHCPGPVMVLGQAAGDCQGAAAGLLLRQKGAKNMCWFLYQHPESSALKQNQSKSPLLYNTGIPKPFLPAPHPAQASRERGETRNEPAQLYELHNERKQRSDEQRGWSTMGTSLWCQPDEVSAPDKLWVLSVRRDHIHPDECR